MVFARRRGSAADPLTRPTGLEQMLRLGDIARDEGRVEDAVTHYQAALALAPERNDIKVQLGNMLKDLGRLGEADAVYRDAQEHDPEDADIGVQRGHVRKLMGDRAGAFEQYRRAAALNPDSFGAVEELAEVGDSWQQGRRFEVHLRAGGTEALMAVSRQLAALRSALDAARAGDTEALARQLADTRTVLDEIATRLPDAVGQTAFPLEVYDLFRALHAVPPPPPGPREAVTVLLPFDREAPATLADQLAALQAGSVAPTAVLAFGSDPERRAVVERFAAADGRVRCVPQEDGESAVAVERRLASGVEEGWLMLLAPGAVPVPQAVAWAAALPSLGTAFAYVCDEDAGRPGLDGPVAETPVFRQVVDYDTLLEANVFGETLIVEAAAFRRLADAVPDDSFGQARGRLLLGLAREGHVGHLPHVLVSRFDHTRPSLPDQRLAIAAHAARHGFANRIVVAKGESGPTTWLPRDPSAGLTVAITVRGDGHDLVLLVRSLRELAAVPDSLRFVILTSGDTPAAARAALDELAARRYVRLISDPAPLPWARLGNQAMASADSPLLVFADDDMTMLTDGWDARLRGLLERVEIGAVGARLLYGDDIVQHAGVLFGWKGGTVHDGLYAEAGAPGPARRLQVTRATGAVSGAFLATRRDRLLALGGFDEAFLPDDYADLDYCLRLREDGRRVIWTPGITLRHHESRTRGFDHLLLRREAQQSPGLAALRRRWPDAFMADPALNPVWVSATVPFRLMAAPSAERVLTHVRLTSRPNPWGVSRSAPA